MIRDWGGVGHDKGLGRGGDMIRGGGDWGGVGHDKGLGRGWVKGTADMI